MSLTNSNSIAGILVYALNNKKSGFRGALLKKIREDMRENIKEKTDKKSEDFNIPDDTTVFYDGTHHAIEELDRKEVDIYGRDNKENLTILIEVKANKGESVQEDSQGPGKKYAKVAQKKKCPLLFILPDGYDKKGELQPESENNDIINNLYVKYYYWSEIRDIAREYDNTGLAGFIEYFVDSIDTEGDSRLLSDIEKYYLIADPKHFNKTFTTIKKIYAILSFVTSGKKENKLPLDKNKIGLSYNDETNWIGLRPNWEPKFFLSIAVSKDKKPGTLSEKSDNVHVDGNYYYTPYNSDEAKEIDPSTFEKIDAQIKKNTTIKKCLDNKEQTINNINVVYSSYNKIVNLVKNYLESIGLYSDPGTEYAQKNETGIGHSFGNKKLLFLGVNPAVNIEDNYAFSLAIRNSIVDKKYRETGIFEGQTLIAKYDSKEGYFFFPLSDEKELFLKFLLSKTPEEQQKTFNDLVEKALNKALKFISEKKYIQKTSKEKYNTLFQKLKHPIS
jgi:hypothetical protein